MLREKDQIDIIIPIYNEAQCIDALISRLEIVRTQLDPIPVHFIFVNDGSTDESLQKLIQYSEKHKYMKLINLSRNFGHQLAVTAGLDYSDATHVAIIDADLQDPPEVIEQMYLKSKEGYDIVYGQRLRRKGETIFKRFTAAFFYRLMNKLCDINIPKDVGDFRLINRKVLTTIKKMRERHRFIRGMMPWVGFRSTAVLYNRDERFAGSTKYPLSKMIRLSLDAIFSFSNLPLKIAGAMGLLIVLIGVIMAIFLLYLKLFTTFTVPGITAVILTVIILGGFQIIFLGILGDYIGRIFDEAKNRPLYIVSFTENLTE